MGTWIERFLYGGLIAFVFLICNPSKAYAIASLELYGTFHAMGAIVTIDAGDDPDQDATAEIEYRSGAQAFRQGFSPEPCVGYPLCREPFLAQTRNSL